MKFKFLSALVFFGCSLISHAQENSNLAGNVSIASDYLWRGITLSNEQAVVQAALEYFLQENVYLSILGTNYVAPGGSEMDFVGGVRKSLTNVSFDFSVANLIFLQDASQNTLDISLRTFWKENTFLMISYIPNYFGTDSDSAYSLLGHELELAPNRFAGAEVGYNTFSNHKRSEINNYINGNVYIKFVKGDQEMSITYSQTNRKSFIESKEAEESDQMVVAKFRIEFN